MLRKKEKKNVLPFTSSDVGGLLIGHTDVMSRTGEQRGQMEVSCLRSSRIPFFRARVLTIFTDENETNKFRRWRLNTLITINEVYTTRSVTSGK